MVEWFECVAGLNQNHSASYSVYGVIVYISTGGGVDDRKRAEEVK
jgi:hypothetical protein